MGGLEFSKARGALCALALCGLMATQGLGCARYSTGKYHTLAKGENLYRLSREYGVPVETLRKANRIDNVAVLQVGEQIWIPRSGQGRRNGPTKKQARVAARQSGNLVFVWPVEGARISSNFGRRKGRPHEGLDLAVSQGTAIRAAEAGRVIHSGWLGDYGKVVIIKHAGYYRTVYAHASKIYVSQGDFVDRGQKIALVGSTGRSTGPHLHFEIRKGEEPANPIAYLP
ncbi:MAG: hypothetical protein CL917_03600 [Deltaproteobacteria bacterium]|nr:hypothetical protein [Deltaproteobacteria bacterium]